ncbi:MAG: C4-dicarboxylate ABC transporter permease [Rhodobacteraceae bacterium CG17_big_fil_post_rev_8_21_14_2_50_65_11]|nr:MAG: C4-dicarboxylate ABC transporter permease [Rhodobacteraceae bacterium CG17_big_fil_post_rev_8_21_14_2_50_65_11]
MIHLPLRILAAVNTVLLRVGRSAAWMALVVMVGVILLQVFFRYVLNNALAWPDEAARFLMLWMTGLIAPSAYRWGGFVAIDMVPEALPRVPGLVLSLALLLVSLAVLVMGVKLGWNHTTGFSGNFNSGSLRIPLDWFGGEMVRVKLRYTYASLLVGMALLTLVNIELILRAVTALLAPATSLPPTDAPIDFSPEAE